jgi:hypothetical protein
MPALAQSPDLIDADRPGLADTSTVIGKGRWQMESGLQWEPGDGEHSFFFPTLFRIGLSDRFEARLEGNTFSWVDDHGDRQSGLAPFSIGAEAVLMHGDDRKPGFGVIGRVVPAWGTGVFEANRLTGDVRLVSDWAFSDRFSLNPNIGVGWYEGEHRDFTTALFALTLSYATRPNLAWFIDTGGQSTEDDGGVASLVVDAGVAYVHRENWQFDISAGKRALGRTSAQAFVSIGFAYRHK